MKFVLGRLANVAGRCVLYSGVWVLLTASFSSLVSAQASEASLRVAFVYNFLKFIEWPQPSAPISLCALGAEGMTRQSLAQLEKKSRQQRQIQVVYLDQMNDLQEHLGSCQMIYRPDTGVDFVVPAYLPPGVLLVADEPDPNDKQVAIALIRTLDNRIEFVINENAIEQSGAKVSSQLLKLAKKPRKEPR